MNSRRLFNILPDPEQSVETSSLTEPNNEDVTAQPQKKKKRVKKQNGSKGVAKTASAWMVQGRSNIDRIRELRTVVEKAIADHKIFTVVGVYPALRRALKRRGWLEKRGTIRPRKPKKPTQPSLCSINWTNSSYGNVSLRSAVATTSRVSSAFLSAPEDNDDMLVARLLKDSPPADFLWTMKDSIEWSNLTKYQLVNRFQRAYFNTKVGLCTYMQQMHWYCEVGVSDTHFPRCYTIGMNNELAEFKYDYHITACLNLLKWLVVNYESGGEQAVQSETGRIPPTVIEFAVARAKDYISKHDHEDIDRDCMNIWDGQWNQFLTCYYMIVHEKNLLHGTDGPSMSEVYETAKDTLAIIRKYWPHLDEDGIHNIWIVKPGNKSRGRGIKLMSRLKDILARANPNVARESRYVVQKYIERPMLIYNTKFDIRQWFLVTCADPLTIWMYKECYLRFCSQSFSLNNMHEAIHLCNNAVQSRYKNGKRDSPDLPEQNMWDSHMFKDYLSKIGHDNVWETRIYPGMKEGIIGTLLAAQENMGTCSNCFELFGADFMLTEDFSTWLIEINSCPDLSSSTSITARLCPQCLEDVIKVVVDRRVNRNASTGMFELVYRQFVPRVPKYCALSLAVNGRGIFTDKKKHKTMFQRPTTITRRPSTISHSETKCRIKRYAGPIIDNLIDGLARNLDQACVEFEKSGEDRKESKVKLNNQRNGAAKKKNRKGPKKALKKTNKKIKTQLIAQESNAQSSNNTPLYSIDKAKDIEETACFTVLDLSYTRKSKDKEEAQVLTSQDSKKPAKENSGPSPKTIVPGDNVQLKKHGTVKSLAVKTVPIPETLFNFDNLLSASTQLAPKDEINAYIQALHHLNQTKASCEGFLEQLKMFKQNNGLMATPNYLPIHEEESANSNKPVICQIVNKLAESQPEREFFVDTNGQGFVSAFTGISSSRS